MDVDEKKRKRIEWLKRRAEKIAEMKKADYDERKEMALLYGKRYVYLACPLCGLSRPIYKHLKGRVWFGVPELKYIVQVRYGGGRTEDGRSIGMFLCEEESIKFDELKEKAPEIYENLKREVKKLYDLLFKEGK